MNTRTHWIAALACTAVGLTSAWAGNPKGSSGEPSYTVFRLDDLNGTVTQVIPRDINNSNEVVGQVSAPTGALQAVYWTTNPNTGGSRLSLLADGLAAYSINDHGEIVGGQIEADGNSIGRYWRTPADDLPLRLLPLVGDEESAAYAINRDGVIVGWSQRNAERHPVVWRIIGGVVHGPFELPNLLEIDPTADPDNAFGIAVSLNDADALGVTAVVGSFMLPNYERTDAARWTIAFDSNGQLVASASVLASGASATHVNNNDVSCGEVIVSTPSPLAAVWTPTERILSRLGNINENSANQINTDGRIVGWGWVVGPRDSGSRAVLWSNADSEMIQLDAFLGRKSSLGCLENAMAINDHNVIVGQARSGAFLAVPQ